MSMQIVHVKDVQALIVKGKKGDAHAWHQARELLYKLINAQPKNVMLLYLLACMNLEEGNMGLATALLERCVQLEPKTRDAWSALTIGYRREGFREDAMRCIEEALRLDPNDADALNNAGSLWINEGAPDRAIEVLRKASKNSPGHSHARWNLGLALLENEEWEEGFKNYTWGLRTNDRFNKQYGQAQWWHGEKCKTLVVYDEQGVGDSVMFMSVLPDLYESGLAEHVIFDCHPRFEALAKRSFPWADVFGTRKEIEKEVAWLKPAEAKYGPMEYKTSIAELCVHFRKDETGFKKRAKGYMEPKMDLVQHYDAMIKRELGTNKVILISHVGGHKKTRKDVRSIPLDTWLPLFKAHPDAVFVSCDYSNRDEEYAKLYKDHGVQVLLLPQVFEADRYQSWAVLDPNGQVVCVCKDKEAAKVIKSKLPGSTLRHDTGAGYDLDDFFAFLVALGLNGGLVVTVNNSTVHFAGSLGVPCYTLTPRACAWRYGLTREDMVWYDSVRQFRQDPEAGWGPTFDQLSLAVGEYFNEDVAKGEAA